MANLKVTTSMYQEELRDGIADVVFWREKRSWKAEIFWPESTTGLYAEEDCKQMKEILDIDSRAVVINGRNCPFTEESSVEFMANCIKRRYEDRSCLLLMRIKNVLLSDEMSEFMQSEIGEKLANLVQTWDHAMRERAKCSYGNVGSDVVWHWDNICQNCRDQWEIFKLVLKQFYGMEIHFSSTQKFFGVCNEDASVWLMKVTREKGTDE